MNALSSRSCLAVILAAGEGTRMHSSLPKVLHKVANRSMLGHALSAVVAAGANKIAVVIGPNREDVAAEVHKHAPHADIFVQEERLGTAHAVLAARGAFEDADDIIVAYADTPLVTAETYARLRTPLSEGAAVVALGFHSASPQGYGRLLMENGALAAIREDKDATAEEKQITFCNAGLMAFSGREALSLLLTIDNKNAKGEYYLTDAVALAKAKGLNVTAVEAPEDEVAGVNDRVQLAAAEQILQIRLRDQAMRSGVTLIDPASVFFSSDTKLGRDVVVEPHVWFGPKVVVDDHAVIHGFSHLEGAHVHKGASIGPFARLRPGTVIGAEAKVGNFVELKNTHLHEGAKAGHLSYLGDATIGKDANIGAGTITCNYDGFRKFKTEIGKDAFIGSNSALVAPVRIGEGAYVGSGSVITADVPDHTLALGRGHQVLKEGWVQAFKSRQVKG